MRCTSESVEPPRHSPALLPEHSRMNARDRRGALHLVDREQQRAIDETVNRLFMNGIIGERDELNPLTLPQVKRPNRDGFVADPRPDVPIMKRK